jgi:type 1 glutamine amidotransferase
MLACFSSSWRRLSVVALVCGVVIVGTSPGSGQDKKDERDIFDYEAQKAAKDVKKIVLIAGTEPHGQRGNHEFVAAAMYFARTINATYPNAYCVVHLVKSNSKDQFPKDLKHADAVIVLLNHSRNAVNPAIKEAIERGAGFAAIHYGVEVEKGEQGQFFLKALGGYFEAYWSVNPFWTPEFKDLPKHDITRGVKPFTINDEWYYHMRFVDKMEGVTPILSAVAPVQTITSRWKEGDKPKTHEGNPDVLADVKAGKPQVVAWAYERPSGKGRGFGFSGLHKHSNLGDDNFRTLLLNAVAWVSGLPVPEKGIRSEALSRQDLEQLIDDGKIAMKKQGK